MDAYAKRTGRDPRAHFAIGDAATIVQRIADYVAGGISKFVLRPVGSDDAEMLAQTRQVIEQVLPLVASRWTNKADKNSVKPTRQLSRCTVRRGGPS